jgi:hypothetical protein
MKIGMTGSRSGISDEALTEFKAFLEKNEITEFHHGDCVGADRIFHNIVSSKYKVVIHPPDKDIFRAFCKGDEIREKKPYTERNRDIVDETDMLIAFPLTEKEVFRSGTWSTIRYAKKVNKEVIKFLPPKPRPTINIVNFDV